MVPYWWLVVGAALIAAADQDHRVSAWCWFDDLLSPVDMCTRMRKGDLAYSLVALVVPEGIGLYVVVVVVNTGGPFGCHNAVDDHKAELDSNCLSGDDDMEAGSRPHLVDWNMCLSADAWGRDGDSFVDSDYRDMSMRVRKCLEDTQIVDKEVVGQKFDYLLVSTVQAVMGRRHFEVRSSYIVWRD